MNKEIQDIISSASEKLSKKRFRHSLGVMYTAANMAMRYDADIEKASIAGILHDIAKEYSDSKLIEVCTKNDIIITDYEMKKPYLLHGKAAACIAAKKYNIKDEDILSAIAYHTVGKKEMTTLEAIIFIADYIEPNRKIVPGLPEIRKEAFVDYNKAAAMILRNVIDYINESDKNLGIDGDTMGTFEYYKKYL